MHPSLRNQFLPNPRPLPANGPTTTAALHRPSASIYACWRRSFSRTWWAWQAAAFLLHPTVAFSVQIQQVQYGSGITPTNKYDVFNAANRGAIVSVRFWPSRLLVFPATPGPFATPDPPSLVPGTPRAPAAILIDAPYPVHQESFLFLNSLPGGKLNAVNNSSGFAFTAVSW